MVAEGIEREVQARELERLGCTHAQGFLFSRPLAVADIEGLLTANQPLGPKRGSSLVASDDESGRYLVPSPFTWP